MRMRPSGALIVGGGPAGSAAAIVLAHGGAAPLLVERDRETGDAICGGFLSWRTLVTLEGLGIDRARLNPAAITRVRLYAGDRVAEARLPRPGLAVSRRRLDTVLLDAAAAAGAGIERGVTARSIDGTRIEADSGLLTAKAVLLATGKHELRGAHRTDVEADPVLGLRVRLAASPALARTIDAAVELHMFDRGYAGVAMQEDGHANLCLAVRRSRLREAGSPRALLDALGSGALGERLAGLTDADTIDAIANVPYGWRVRATTAGVYRLGDQAGVIPSLAGEGMGIALASGASAAQAVLNGIEAPQWQRGFARRLARPIGVADVVRHLLERPMPAAGAVAFAGVAPILIRGIARLTRVARTL